MGRKSAISFPGAHAAASRYAPGDTIAERYRLVRPLGEGGMGVVWIAYSLALDVDVALKVIAADLAGTAAAERMAQEARAAARLGHPAMVRVMDFGQTEHGDPYLVMELLHGEMLSDLIDRDGRLSAVDAVRMLLPIADGLATAHDAGIVHRDLKPDNVFVARDAVGRLQPKLLDFGIAKLQDNDFDRKITAMGSVVGSPDYMSPEQAHGRDDIDHRSDVWAFCVVLYEAVTGQVPFSADNYNGLMFAIINSDPAPITGLGAGDADLWRVLERGLQKSRDERWSSMWELGEALALWAYEQGIKEDITSRSIKGSWLDAGLSGIQVIVPQTIPPDRPTDPHPPEPASHPDDVDALLLEKRPDSSSSITVPQAPAAPGAKAVSEPAPRRARWLLVVALGLAAGAALVFGVRARPQAVPALASLLGRAGLLEDAESTMASGGAPVTEAARAPLKTTEPEKGEPSRAEDTTGAPSSEHNAAQAPGAASAQPVASPPASASVGPAPPSNAPPSPQRKRPKRARDFGF